MSDSQHNNHSQTYRSKLSRRESLKWLGLLSATTVIPLTTSCATSIDNLPVGKGHWPQLKLPAITATGYGKDPNVIIPPSAPWPKTLSSEQLGLVATLCDILIPREGDVPSATEVNVPDVIDEWISAPYSRQEQDRQQFLALLIWLDDEARLRFNAKFTQVSTAQQLAIMDDISYDKSDLADEFRRATQAFSSFRRLVLAAFFCSPEGTKDLGYIGNIPIAGDYPGPTDEAMAHLQKVLGELGLSA
ncbi:gluconate 2-dehydrogenase subunit 3 family protein [Alteromonadaceae bacterium BrNp21-10]|nr:gluconate 2-dehydrogenase subunit 3 family protein [Alteromonadaceae bacterium BrNp21-10]